MILLALLYYLSISSTLAVPRPAGHPPLPPAVSNFQSILSRENAPSNTRTIWNIIWSCLSTLFACAWIAVHPNIPAPKDSQWKIFRRRMKIMAYVLLAPEMIIIWAARQHHDAGLLAKDFQIKGRPTWTKTHAFFLIMGGFTLYEKGNPLRVLDWRDLEALVRAGRIDWPDITEEEIKDKSKGDYLSKSIVVLQSTWFIVQFFARVASKITITELEVVTLAFSSLTGVIYYLWWNKPLDVRCSVPVHLMEKTTEPATSDNVAADGSSPECFRFLPPLDLSPTILDEEAPGVDQIETSNLPPSSPPNVPSSRPTLQNSGSNFVPSIIMHSPPERPFLVDRPSGPMNAKWKNLYFIVRYYCREDGTVMGLVHGFNLVYSLLFGYQFYAMMNECTLNKTDNRKPNDHPFNSLHSEALRVPTFYSYTAVTWERFVFAICVSILFGVIHSVAWYYGFSTSPEKWGWRISSIIVSVAPLILLSMFTASRMRIVKQSSFIFSFFCNGFALAYICSRIALLLFPLIALRALPPGSYVDLDWATVIPHI